MASWWEKTTGAVGGAADGTLSWLDRLAGSKLGQAAIDLGTKYVNKELDPKVGEEDTTKKTQWTLPPWVAPVGIGIAGLLTLGLIVSIAGRSRGK